MKFHHVIALAFVLLASCSNQSDLIAKATQQAEFSATRAQQSAGNAENAADQASAAAVKVEEQAAHAQDAENHANDVVARFCSCPQPAFTGGPGDQAIRDCYKQVRQRCGPN